MPTSLKYVLFSLIVIFFGLSVYLGYLYFGESEGPIRIKSQKVTLTGQVLSGTKALQNAACPTQYYLVSGARSIWLTKPDGSDVDWPVEFARYKYSDVEISGENRQEGAVCKSIQGINCGCHDFLIVDNVAVMKEGKLLAKEYEGEIACAEGIKTSSGSCVRGLKLASGEYYFIEISEEIANRSGFVSLPLEAKVRVLGILNGDILDVFEIERID